MAAHRMPVIQFAALKGAIMTLSKDFDLANSHCRRPPDVRTVLSSARAFQDQRV